LLPLVAAVWQLSLLRDACALLVCADYLSAAGHNAMLNHAMLRWCCALQVCTDYLSAADHAMAKAGLRLVDRQLAAAPLSSSEGRDYLAAMAAAANFAFANRCAREHLAS
jgi:RNA-splicing ligase RtcB